MAGTTLHLNGFQPQGCPDVVNTSAITSLGGTSTIDVFTATDAVNQTVVGGGSGTIGMGGYLTGGGHGLLSARYGLATDQVLEMEVVTPSGDIVIANACQNKDLFWAMRGVCSIHHPSGLLFVPWSNTSSLTAIRPRAAALPSVS